MIFLKRKELEQLKKIKQKVSELEDEYDENKIVNELYSFEKGYVGPEKIWVSRLLNQAKNGQIPLHDVIDSMGKFIRQIEVEVKTD